MENGKFPILTPDTSPLLGGHIWSPSGSGFANFRISLAEGGSSVSGGMSYTVSHTGRNTKPGLNCHTGSKAALLHDSTAKSWQNRHITDKR